MKSTSHSLAEIAQALGAQAHGDTGLRVNTAAEPVEAGPNDLALAMSEEYAAGLGQGRARAAMLWHGADWRALGLEGAIWVERPRFAMAGLTALLAPQRGFGEGIHPSAVIAPGAQIANGVSIGPLSVVGEGARIGENSTIGAHCVIAPQAHLGPNAHLSDGVKIGHGVQIGARFIAQPGVSVGGDGFAFVTPEKSGVEEVRESLGEQRGANAQSWHRIHSLGGVRIGDDVEIGANSCIDRGTIRDTVIGNGTKMDNLVQIGHNVITGEDCLICAQVGVAGSTRLGNNVVLGGQSGISDNLTLGDHVITGGGTIVLSNQPAGRVLLGYPAMKMERHIESYKALRRLPRLLQRLQKSGSNTPQE